VDAPGTIDAPDTDTQICAFGREPCEPTAQSGDQRYQRGSDACGNAVPVADASWSVSDGTPGTVSQASGASTVFTASPTTSGSGAVVATDGSVTGSASVTVIAIAAPTNLTANGGRAEVSLSWHGNAGAASYNVYRGTSA
jgi:hypothetical protein